MCAIAGLVGPAAAEYGHAVKAMLAVMRHRGPNGTGIWVAPSGRCVLGHNRLSILDLTSAADQPMASPSGREHLVYNGECYNYLDLRTELEQEGETFRSTGDTEVVLRMLVRHGRNALGRLNAMFAIALWDEPGGTLLLARDRFGQKPLYYFFTPDGLLVFASEVRGLLASGLVPRRLNPRAVAGFLSQGSVQGPDTIVQGVLLLPRASWLTFSVDARVGRGQYWCPPMPTREDDPDALRATFEAAVERHLVSDVPIGVFLSGGLDSSLVAAATARQKADVTTLCVTYPDHPTNEAEHAASVARHLNTRHVEIPMTDAAILSIVDQAVEAMDQPTIDAVNTLVVSTAARKAGLTVALSGLGGDEVFGGYSTFVDFGRFITASVAWPAARAAALATRILRGPFSRYVGKLDGIARARGDVLAAYRQRRGLFSPSQIRRLAPGLDVETPADQAGNLDRDASLSELIRGRPLTDQLRHLELEGYMGQTLLRDADVMGMAVSLEIRCPFLDTDLTDLALSSKLDPVSRGGRRKWRMVEAMGSWLPRGTLTRPKQGFAMPWEAWFAGPLKERLWDEVHSLGDDGVIDASAATALYTSYQSRPKSVGWSRPWSVYVLCGLITRFGLT